ncbi:substrate-binding domain-containing protein [Spirillospora sp. CA-255316]
MTSYLDRKADFTRDLLLRLDGHEPAALARRTGLREATVRSLLAGDGELMSWEVVSACLAAAGVDGGGAARVRDRWAAAEQALWDERGEDLRAAFERNRNGKPARVAEAHRAKVPWRRLASRHPVTLEPWTVPAFDSERRLPDPSEAADIRDFYRLLAELRVWAGSPRQSEIERRSWGTLPDATISAMLQKDRWRTTNDRERVRVGYFAAACGLPEAEVARWVEAYERLRHIAPPDDLAQARAEAAELRRRLAGAEAEAQDLRERLAAAETRRPAGEPAPAASAAPAAPAPRRRSRWDPRGRRALAAAVAVLVFAGGVGVGRVAAGGGSEKDRSVCFSGTLRLVGSTAFERTANAIRRGYEAMCEDATIEVRSIGSNEGVRALTPANAASTIAMHDGHLKRDSEEIRLRGFRGFPVALTAFAVVVHKDTGLTGLSVRDLRSIYARDGGPTGWSRFRGGADLPILMVSRTEGSGTRTIFEEQVLNEPEPELSSRDCRRKDEIRAAARIIRCERSSQTQILETVNRLPGAIGYAELQVATDTRRYPNLRILTLDGRRADTSPAEHRYPFVAPEVFYTYGTPPNDSPAAAFLTFLGGDSARRLIQRAGAPPCVTADALISTPCQAP